MYAEWKLLGRLNQASKPVLIAKIRTEHEVAFDPDSMDAIKSMIRGLSDDPELVSRDQARFAYELQQIVDAYYHLSDNMGDLIGLVETKWKPFTGHLSYSALTHMAEALDGERSVRIEGSPEEGMWLHLGVGVDIQKLSVDESRLRKLRSECEAIAAEDARNGVFAAVKDWVMVVVAVIDIGIKVWDRYHERQREKDEQERRKKDAEDQKVQRERTVYQSSSGGPRDAERMDRISKIA